MLDKHIYTIEAAAQSILIHIDNQVRGVSPVTVEDVKAIRTCALKIVAATKRPYTTARGVVQIDNGSGAIVATYPNLMTATAESGHSYQIIYKGVHNRTLGRGAYSFRYADEYKGVL